jgi:hypothetical protein
MRGRKPRRLTIAAADEPVPRWIAQDHGPPAFQVQRARIVLASAEGRRICEVALQNDCDEATVWRACRRYERSGLSGLLADGRRSA